MNITQGLFVIQASYTSCDSQLWFTDLKFFRIGKDDKLKFVVLLLEGTCLVLRLIFKLLYWSQLSV